MDLKEKKSFLIRIAFIAVWIAILVLLFRFVVPVTVPFIIGLLVAFILQKPVAFLTEKTRLKRGIWSTVLVVLLLALLFAAVSVLGVVLYNELVSFASSLTKLVPSISDTFASLSDSFERILNRLPEDFADSVRGLPGKMAGEVAGYFGTLVTKFAASVVSGLPAFLLTFLISVIAGVFITSDYNSITGFVLRQLPARWREITMQAKAMFMQSVLRMLGCYLLLMLITFAELTVGFNLLKIESPAALALFISFVDILPVLGVGTILIPWGIIELLLGNTLLGIELLILYVIITVIRNILEPRIVGKSMDLHPLVTLIAMYVGLQAMGIFGLFLFPVAVIIVINLQKAGVIHLWKERADTQPQEENAADPAPQAPDGSDGGQKPATETKM